MSNAALQTQSSNESFVDKVDFTAPDAAQRFCNSLKNSGFAIVRNTPISQQDINNGLSSWRAFFHDNTLEDKNKYLHDKTTQTGYFPFLTENAKDQATPDLKEFYHSFNFTDLPVDHMPDAMKVAQLIYQMNNLGLTLLGYIADDLNDQSVVQTAIEGNNTLYRAIYYPALAENVEVTGVRAAAHEDINLITVLPAASDSGLEVKDAQGNWHLVDYQEGDIVVNVGDMLQMKTDYAYKSTTHQVKNPDDLTRDRVSMPLFIHAHADYDLGPMTAGEYLDQRLREIGLK